jgi:ribonuclease HII
MKYIVGIDEVGRGPLAGPVTVCAVVCDAQFYKKLKRNRSLPVAGKDSKKLSPEMREKYFELLCSLKNPKNSFSQKLFRGTRFGLLADRSISAPVEPAKPPKKCFASTNFLDFSVIHISNKQIDKIGISNCIKRAIVRALEGLIIENSLKTENSELKILLDGGLRAPAKFANQKTIIKGDEKEKIIAWASILAKVSRDNLMTKLDKKFPQYGFAVHKGYGTARHRDAIKKHGLSHLHRKSFCKKFV